MNMELKIINIKLKASKFVHLGCGNLTEEDKAEREAEEAKKAKEAEERKQAFIDSWNEDDRDFFKVQLRECGYNDTDEAVDSFRKRIEREYEDWHERNQWVKTWTNFLDGENIIGYIYGNL